VTACHLRHGAAHADLLQKQHSQIESINDHRLSATVFARLKSSAC
jgi:hypothetical protein